MTKTNVQQHLEFQQYTNYIDTSDVMLGFYKNQSTSGLQKYILMIEDWLNVTHQNVENNKPLIIQADGGVGKKTLINKWYQYHESTKQQKKKDLILLHFATTGGNNSNYFYALYRILIKLRETLNIGQKVELHQEKLRKYFSYWLQVCNQTIENQVINNPEVIYEKIILVFEGIDYFVDRDTNKQGNIAFWLPKYFPKNIKVIVTADRQSETMKHFMRLNCQKVKIPIDSSIIKSMIKKHCQKQLVPSETLRKRILSILDQMILKQEFISLYVKGYLSCFLPQIQEILKLSESTISQINQMLEGLQFQKLKGLHTIDQLFDYILQFWGKKIFKNQEKFKELLGLLICTQKGLTKAEIMLISRVTIQQLKCFITVFRSFLMNFKHLWMIKNDCFRRAINKKYKFKYQQIHEKIADSLKKTPNSLRKLQQETYQLYNAKSYFKLKQIISDVENFLLLFNPYNKYDLCRYWQKLEEKSFDPVIEYNKAVQNFQMHYHPSSQDLFRITVQISRFLKEFADFETYYTPKFRHPEILGNYKQMNDIGLLGEFNNLGLCQSTDQKLAIEDKTTASQPLNGQKDLREKVQEMLEKLEKGKNIKKEVVYEKKNEQNKQKQVPKQEKKKKKQTAIQQSNVQVKSNQANFRDYYYKQIQQFLKKVALDKNHQTIQVSHIEEQQNSDNEQGNDIPTNFVDLAKLKGLDKQKDKNKQQQYRDLRKLFSDSMQEQFELNQKPPTNYYYKRWIWMQFPWVCMTMKCDYSAKIKRCFTSPTEYMTVSEQKEFTIQSLKIALQAKKKKQAVLEQKTVSRSPNEVQKAMENSKSSLNPVTTKYQHLPLTKDGGNLSSSQTKSKKNFDQIAYLTSSFLNLQTLTRQIQNINNKGIAKGKYANDTQSSVFLTQSKNSLNGSGFLHGKSLRKKPTVYQTEVSTSKIKQGLLPRIKQSMNNQMQKQLESLEKNNANMRKQMDYYLYMNKTLAKKLKQLKIIEFNNQSQIKNVKKIDETKEKIAVLEQKLQKIKYQYAYSLLQQERLNILIKICKYNKTQNQQAIPPLTFECNNFKKMIKWEKQAIDQINRETQQIKKISTKFLINCSEKRQNQINLNQQIKLTLKNRTQFQTEVEKYDSMIMEEVEHQRKKIDEQIKGALVKKEQKDNNSSQKNKKAMEAAENYEQMYKEISEHLTLQNQAYKQDPKYIKLGQGLSKKRQLIAIIQERKHRLEELEKQYKQEERSIQTLEKINEESVNTAEQTQQQQQTGFNQQQLIYAYQRQIHEKQRIYTKLLETKLSCFGMLNTWETKMNLPPSNQLVITEQFVQKIKELVEQKQNTNIEPSIQLGINRSVEV